MAKSPARTRSKTERSGTSKNRSTSKKSQNQTASTSSKLSRTQTEHQEVCLHCDQQLNVSDKALYVEEEVYRIFCSEDCITEYFGPDIERLEKEYEDNRPSHDLKPDERDALAHLRWVTLEQPDESWVQKSISGDLRYTLISEFQIDNRSVWCVCICLCLKGEPSFLFLSFVTRAQTLLDHFRKGEPIDLEKVKLQAQLEAKESILSSDSNSFNTKGGSAMKSTQSGKSPTTSSPVEQDSRTDGLADSWTVEESVRAHWAKLRPANDIPSGQFESFENCIEETLGAPDEVWSLNLTEVNLGGNKSPSKKVPPASRRLFHFIKRFKSESPSMWYIVIARETAKDDQIEILHHFPTKSSRLVEKARSGALEYGQDELPVLNRMVH